MAFKLMAWHVDNFHNIQVFDVEPNGKHVEIKGPNASGKTSRLDSILFALKGVSKGDPNPVMTGADEAQVEILLDNGKPGEELMLRRRITRDGKMQLEVERGGEAVKGAKQGVINTLLNSYMLNPCDFLSLRPQDQQDVLLNLSKSPPPVEAVLDITGKTHQAQEGETCYHYLTRLSGDGTGHYYAARRDAGLLRDVATKALLEAKGEKAQTRRVEVPGDVAQTDNEIRSLEANVERYNVAYNNAKTADLHAANAASTRDSAATHYTNASMHVGDLRHQLELAITQQDQAKGVYESARESCKAQEIVAAKMQLELKDFQDCREALLAARNIRSSQIRLADDAARYTAVCERVTSLTVKAKEADLAYDRLDKILASLRDLRKKSVDVDIGVPGLECGDGVLTVDGLPLPAASTAQLCKIACGVAIKMNPELRLLRIDDGEKLDHRSRMSIYNIADQNDCQVILTSVSDSNDLTVKIVE